MKYLAIFILLLMPTLVFGQDVNRQKLHQQLDEAAARDAHKLNHWHRPLQVEYSPVIVIVPQGVGMGVSAVVSADRRYVRIGHIFVYRASIYFQLSTLGYHGI